MTTTLRVWWKFRHGKTSHVETSRKRMDFQSSQVAVLIMSIGAVQSELTSIVQMWFGRVRVDNVQTRLRLDAHRNSEPTNLSIRSQRKDWNTTAASSPWQAQQSSAGSWWPDSNLSIYIWIDITRKVLEHILKDMRNVGVELRLQSRMIACLWFLIKKMNISDNFHFLSQICTTVTIARQTVTTHRHICLSWMCSSMSGMIEPINATTSLRVIAGSSRLWSWPFFVTQIFHFDIKILNKKYIWSAADRQCGTTDKTMCGTWHSDRGTSSGQANCFQAPLDYLNRLCFPCPGIRKQLLGYPSSGAYVFHPSGNYDTYSKTKHSNQYWNHFRDQLTKQKTCSSYLSDKLFDNENLDWNKSCANPNDVRIWTRVQCVSIISIDSFFRFEQKFGFRTFDLFTWMTFRVFEKRFRNRMRAHN